MENTVTIVTCYYKIPSKRTHDTYDMYIKNFLGNLYSGPEIANMQEQTFGTLFEVFCKVPCV